MASNHEKVEDKIQALRTRKLQCQTALDKAVKDLETEETITALEVDLEMVKADLEEILVRYR